MSRALVRARSTDASASESPVTASPAASATTCGSHLPASAISAAVRSGAATTIGTIVKLRSSLELGDLRRVERTFRFEDLQSKREQECGHGDRHDDVRQRQRLHDRVDHLARRRDVREDGCGAMALVADRKQEDVGRRLADAHAHGEVDQVSARHDPDEADEEDPHCKQVRQDRHLPTRPWRTATFSCRYSEKISAKPPETASADDQLTIAALPPDRSRPVTPNGRKFSRKPKPSARASRPRKT